MNEISKLLNFTINQFETNELVNTITMVPDLELDQNKENIYPLVNINIVDSDILDDVVVVSLVITAISQRDVRPNKTDSKLLLDTNFIDNLNETHSILQQFVNYLERKNNSENIEVYSKSRVTFYKDKFLSGMDGGRINIQLSIPNKGSAC